MLKIKDNVDLKELEKYGFELTPKKFDKARKIFEDSLKSSIIIRITSEKIIYCVDDEDLYNTGNKNSFLMYDTLYDLIKDGLIEKVGE